MSTATQAKPPTKTTASSDVAASSDVSGETLKNGAQNLAEEAKDYVAQSAGSIADSARETTQQARGKIANAAEHSQDFAAEEYQRCVEGIRRNPLTAIGIASLVGIAIGAGLSLQARRWD